VSFNSVLRYTSTNLALSHAAQPGESLVSITRACTLQCMRGLSEGDGSTVEPHRLHSATAAPLSTGTPLSRVALYTHSQHDSGPSTTASKSCVHPAQVHKTTPTLHPPLSCNDTHTTELVQV
jgi:hypothetical protein